MAVFFLSTEISRLETDNFCVNFIVDKKEKLYYYNGKTNVCSEQVFEQSIKRRILLWQEKIN